MKYTILALLVLSSILITGCIPQNEHVGKPAAHNYNNSYYNDRYYGNGYYR
jgi:hypothetical protein